MSESQMPLTLDEWREKTALMLNKLNNRSDIPNWAWMQTGEKCYAAMVVQAFSADDGDDTPIVGMLTPHPEKDGTFVDEQGRECLIMETVFENEHQSGALECEVAVWLRNTVPRILDDLSLRDSGDAANASNMANLRDRSIDFSNTLANINDTCRVRGFAAGPSGTSTEDRVIALAQAYDAACESRDAAITALRGALQAHAQADNQRLIEHGEAVQEAEKWKSEGDMYGWNFHMGRAGGMTTASIIFFRVQRVLEKLLERFSQCGDSTTAADAQ